MNFKSPFHYNIGGIDLQHAEVRYASECLMHNNVVKTYGGVLDYFAGATKLSLVPEIIISGIRAGSPSAYSGIKEGDVIIAFDGQRVHGCKLQEIV